MKEFKYLKDAQCVRFNDCGIITWHVFKDDEAALKWKRLLVCCNAGFMCARKTDFLIRGGVAVIATSGTKVCVKLRGPKSLPTRWTECKDLEDAEMRVFGRIAELQFD